QAEDGIRDATVTGVQTCALPIFYVYSTRSFYRSLASSSLRIPWAYGANKKLVPPHPESLDALVAELRIINSYRRAQGGSEELKRDRKSTRLNSSHGSISYAVFCL